MQIARKEENWTGNKSIKSEKEPHELDLIKPLQTQRISSKKRWKNQRMWGANQKPISTNREEKSRTAFPTTTNQQIREIGWVFDVGIIVEERLN